MTLGARRDARLSGVFVLVLLAACGSSVSVSPPPARLAVPSWTSDPWLGLLPPCGDDCLDVSSPNEARFVDADGTAWRYLREISPEGTEVWRQREGTIPFVEERRLVGRVEQANVVMTCDGEGARRTEWTDTDRDGDIDTVREDVRSGSVTTSTTDADADGACDSVTRTTTLDAGMRVERDLDCDGVFESSDVSEVRIRRGSGC